MKHTRLSCLTAIALLNLSVPVTYAQAAPAPASPTPTLAQALTQAQPPSAGLTLTVGAAKVTLPKGADAPQSGATVADVAEAYNRLTQDFGNVTVLAPPTMTLVYSPPATPNPYADMPPAQVMQLLTQSFDKAQWKAFMGPQGIGYDDLQTPAQQQLFGALFPNGHLIVEKNLMTDPHAAQSKQDISGPELLQAHLKLGYIIDLALQNVGNDSGYSFSGGPEPPDTPTRYFMMNAQSEDVDREYGAQVRETGPNALKKSQLDGKAATYKAIVPLAGVKTVGDLIAHIAATTHTEIYADPRYATRTIMLLGPDTSAPASDLLQAVALCVTGTYRQVGPAYVLTNGLTGIGTKHALWKDFEARGAAMLATLSTPLPTNFPYTVKDISWGDDPMAFTASEQKQYWAQWLKQGAMNSFTVLDVTLPFSQLSPVQQEVAQQIQQENVKSQANTTLNGTVMVQAEPLLEMTLPSLDGPVIVFQSYQDLLPAPHLTPAEQKIANQGQLGNMAFAPPSPNQKPPVPQPLRPEIVLFARRAARISPKTPQDVKTDMAALKTLGFNEVWLQLPTLPQIRSDDPNVPLLKTAIQEGRKDGIAILPDLSLLHWKAGAPVDFNDLDIEGLTPSVKQSSNSPFNVPNTVTPFEPGVAQRLSTLIQDIGAVPGIGGMVWDDMTPAGYAPSQPDGPDMDSQGDPLGYALAGRLTFLRWAHADPVDLYTNYDNDERAHVIVPGFNDKFNTERDLYNRWCGLRVHQDQILMQQLTATLSPAFGNHPGRLPLIVPPANENGTPPSVYGSWDNFRMPPPSELFITPKGPDGQPLMNVPDIEQMPSALSFHVLPVPIYGHPGRYAKNWADNVASALSDARQAGDTNIVLDISQDTRLLDALIAHGAAKPAAKINGG